MSIAAYRIESTVFCEYPRLGEANTWSLHRREEECPQICKLAEEFSPGVRQSGEKALTPSPKLGQGFLLLNLSTLEFTTLYLQRVPPRPNLNKSGSLPYFFNVCVTSRKFQQWGPYLPTFSGGSRKKLHLPQSDPLQGALLYFHTQKLML